MDTVEELLEKDNESLVGVHCTHGLNRTGYMVCRYLRDRLRVPAACAIDKFEKARGYKIERENYIADLLGKTPPPPDKNQPITIKPIIEAFKDDAAKERDSRNRKKRHNPKYNSPLTHEEEVDGYTMKYGDRSYKDNINYSSVNEQSEKK